MGCIINTWLLTGSVSKTTNQNGSIFFFSLKHKKSNL